MRPSSSAISITVHAAVGAALLLGGAKPGRSIPATTALAPIFFQPQRASAGEGVGDPGIPGPLTIAMPDPGSLPIPATLPQSGAIAPFAGARWESDSGQVGGWSPVDEQPTEILSSPLPVYPELLRQAGVSGRVVLEAVVDTTGRVLAASIQVVSATNPGFVAPARQALIAALFRPASVGGKAVRLRVRIPYEFSIRDGIGRAR